MCSSTAELCLATFKVQGHGSCNALSLFSGTGAHTSKSLGSSDGAIFFFFLSYLQNLSLTWMNWQVQILNLYPYTEVEGLNKAKLLIKDKHRYRGRVLLWAGILFYQLKKKSVYWTRKVLPPLVYMHASFLCHPASHGAATTSRSLLSVIPWPSQALGCLSRSWLQATPLPCPRDQTQIAQAASGSVGFSCRQQFENW